MRISKGQAGENRDRVVSAAAKLIRERGFEVSVADVMDAAGFTHGGFYNHFAAKDDLVVEALERAFGQMAEEWRRAEDPMDLVGNYLSSVHRRSAGNGCPAAALAGDVLRQSRRVKRQFAMGVKGMVDVLEARLSEAMPAADRRRLATDLVARMIGALAIARAIPESDPLGDEILKAARASCAAALRSCP